MLLHAFDVSHPFIKRVLQYNVRQFHELVITPWLATYFNGIVLLLVCSDCKGVAGECEYDPTSTFRNTVTAVY